MNSGNLFNEMTIGMLGFFGIEPDSSVGRYLTGVLIVPFKLFSAEGDVHTVFAAALALVYLDSALTTESMPGTPNSDISLAQFHLDLEVYKRLIPETFTSAEFWNSFVYFGYLPIQIRIRVWRAVCWICVYMQEQTDEVLLMPQIALRLYNNAIAILEKHKLA